MIIENGIILSFDEKNRIYTDKSLCMQNGIITDILDKNEARKLYPEEKVIDAGGKYVMPGMVCTHFHTYSAFARGMSLKNYNPADFTEILEQLWWKLDKKLLDEDIFYSALVCAIECVKNGTTTVIDHHASPYNIADSLDLISEGFSRIGVRGSYCYEVSDRDGEETATKGIEENVRFIKKTKELENPLIKASFGLHAAFTLSDETIKKAVEEEKKLGSGFHIHLSEGITDEQNSMSKHGKTATERLKDSGILKENSLLIHGVYLNEKDMDFIKESGSFIIHNPQSNMNNGLELPQVDKMLDKNMVLGMGTDGFTTDMFREMSVCYVAHKYAKHNSRVMSPDTVKKIMFENNGKIAEKIWSRPGGVIKEGALADIIIVDYKATTPLNEDNLSGHLVFGMGASNVESTIINGKMIMENRKILGVDEDRIFGEARKTAQKLWERING